MLLKPLLGLWRPLAQDRKITLHREISYRVQQEISQFKMAMKDRDLLELYTKLEHYFPHGMHTPPAIRRSLVVMLRYANTCYLLAQNKKISARFLDEFRQRVYSKNSSQEE